MGSIAGEVRRLSYCAHLAATIRGEVTQSVDVARIDRDRRIVVLVTFAAGNVRAYGSSWEEAMRIGAEPLARRIVQLIKGELACQD